MIAATHGMLGQVTYLQEAVAQNVQLKLGGPV